MTDLSPLLVLEARSAKPGPAGLGDAACLSPSSRMAGSTCSAFLGF